jgi:hypothetical protein
MKKSLFLATLQMLLLEAWAQRDAAQEGGIERDTWSAVAGHLENARKRLSS